MMVSQPNIIKRKITAWTREKRRLEVITGCLAKDAPDVVKVKHHVIERFIEDLEELNTASQTKR